MRVLYYVPIYHSRVEYGDHDKTTRKISRSVMPRWWKLIDKFWREMHALFAKNPPPLKGLRIYGDSQCRPNIQAYKTLARRGSSYAKLILNLLAGGAVLRKTESKTVFLKNIADKSMATPRSRDRYIARRINLTLPAGGYGILFLGIGHGTFFVKLLSKDILVINLLTRRQIGKNRAGYLHGITELSKV